MNEPVMITSPQIDRASAEPVPARIHPIVDPDPDQAALLAKAPTLPDGTIRNIFLTLVWHPTLLKRFNAMMGTFMRFGELSDHDREICILRVAAHVRSQYELAQHVPIAQEAGVGDELIESVIGLGPVESLPGRERLLCAVADQITVAGQISDELWSEVRATYPEPAAVELVMLTCQYRAVGDFLNVLGVEPEADMKALLTTWLPKVGSAHA